MKDFQQAKGWVLTFLISLISSVFIYEIRELRKSVQGLNYQVGSLIEQANSLKTTDERHDREIKFLFERELERSR
jgi:hypothetical protein